MRIWWCVVYGSVILPLEACGPWFPNTLLGSGSGALLDAPAARFLQELEAMEIKPSRFEAKPATNSFSQQTAEAEFTDLGRALKIAGRKPAEAARVSAALVEFRNRLNEYLASLEKPEVVAAVESTEKPDLPPFPSLTIPEGLPPEFADYLEGALC